VSSATTRSQPNSGHGPDGRDRPAASFRGGAAGRRLARFWQRVAPSGSPADTVGWIVAWFLIVCLGVQVLALVVDQWRINQWFAYDTNAYWLAAQHLVAGSPLYAPAEIWTGGAYKYPPIYAQMIFPIGWIPELIVDWSWRLTTLLCLRYLCGSWKLSVLASLQWPVWAELSYGNVTLQLAAVALWSFRDARGAYLLPWFAGLKFGPALLIPYFWIVRPRMRRQLAIGCAVFAVACLASFAIAPGLWFDYAGTFGWEASSEMQAMWVYAVVPDHGGLDFAVRTAIALVALVVAIRRRLDWLAYLVAICTMPIFSLTRLAALCGLWPLWLRDVVDRWRATRTPIREWLTAPLVHLDMLPERGDPATG
jgi:hypothetical protein